MGIGDSVVIDMPSEQKTTLGVMPSTARRINQMRRALGVLHDRDCSQDDVIDFLINFWEEVTEEERAQILKRLHDNPACVGPSEEEAP